MYLYVLIHLAMLTDLHKCTNIFVFSYETQTGTHTYIHTYIQRERASCFVSKMPVNANSQNTDTRRRLSSHLCMYMHAPVRTAVYTKTTGSP